MTKMNTIRMPMMPLSDFNRSVKLALGCTEERLGLILHWMAIWIMNITVRMIPGTIPAMNRAAMEVWVMKPNTTKAVLGGIRIPRLPPAAMEPKESRSS